MSKRKRCVISSESDITEFKTIITDYILPLFESKGNLKLEEGTFPNSELVEIVQSNEGSFALFYPREGKNGHFCPFRYKVKVHNAEAVKKLAITILTELLKVTTYNGAKRYYGKDGMRQATYKARTLDLAYELGMCRWFAPNSNQAVILYTVICRMIEWASRTYEGKNVPFGIVIDFDHEAAEDAADYLHFLGNDSSAVFTDGIFTGVLLDKNGKILSFLTKDTQNPDVEQNEDREVFVPYQYVDIAKYCTRNAIGIVALTNGEILLIKNRQLRFAKRGRKWIYFDWSRVEITLRPYFLKHCSDAQEVRKRIQAIYCTLLDVSFAHTGGCLAILSPENEKEIGDSIKDRLDLFESGARTYELSEESKEKIKVLKTLLQNEWSSMRSFFDTERQLRREMLGLDGATMVALDGKFYCVGAIVAVGGGSSGGGRTAAAKKLAGFGIGIKISEDGYIEAFGTQKDPLSRIDVLFRFK